MKFSKIVESEEFERLRKEKISSSQLVPPSILATNKNAHNVIHSKCHSVNKDSEPDPINIFT
jgi:hypothetical protein